MVITACIFLFAIREELENLLKISKHWKDVSSVNPTKVSQLLESDEIDEKLKAKIIALVPLEENIKISVKKNPG